MDTKISVLSRNGEEANEKETAAEKNRGNGGKDDSQRCKGKHVHPRDFNGSDGSETEIEEIVVD